MTGFTLDTSGVVIGDGSGPSVPLGLAMTWSDLSRFEQGYSGAAARELYLNLLARGWKPEDALAAVAFRNWSPATLEAIRKDCRHDQEMGFRIGSGEDRSSAKAGRKFWLERQTGNLFDCPPLTVSLNDAGQVVFA